MAWAMARVLRIGQQPAGDRAERQRAEAEQGVGAVDPAQQPGRDQLLAQRHADTLQVMAWNPNRAKMAPTSTGLRARASTR
jgi:hypothetical protein